MYSYNKWLRLLYSLHHKCIKCVLAFRPAKLLDSVAFSATSGWFLEKHYLSMLAIGFSISEGFYVVSASWYFKNVNILWNESQKKKDYEETGDNG